VFDQDGKDQSEWSIFDYPSGSPSKEKMIKTLNEDTTSAFTLRPKAWPVLLNHLVSCAVALI
jgi:hypothetical protein